MEIEPALTLWTNFKQFKYPINSILKELRKFPIITKATYNGNEVYNII